MQDVSQIASLARIMEKEYPLPQPSISALNTGRNLGRESYHPEPQIQCLLDKMLFDKIHFDEMHFDKMHFDKLHFDKMHFDKMHFDIMHSNFKFQISNLKHRCLE